MRFSPRFKQKRNDDDGKSGIFFAPIFDLREPEFADARM